MRIGLICAALALAAVAGCGGDEDGEGKDKGATEADSGFQYENPPFKARVEITKDGYRPRNVKILVGGSVTFVNLDDSQGHTAETEDLPEGVSDNNEFDTHTLTWEEPYTVTFHKPERIRFFDSLSDFSGTVTAVSKFKPPEPPPER